MQKCPTRADSRRHAVRSPFPAGRGADTGGADALLAQRYLGGLAVNDGGGGNELENRPLEFKLGDGFGVFGGRFTATPAAGLGLWDGHREYTLSPPIRCSVASPGIGGCWSGSSPPSDEACAAIRTGSQSAITRLHGFSTPSTCFERLGVSSTESGHGRQWKASEAAPQTDKACTASVADASLTGALYPSQPRLFTQQTTLGDLAQL